jgi:hypothetical protein
MNKKLLMLSVLFLMGSSQSLTIKDRSSSNDFPKTIDQQRRQQLLDELEQIDFLLWLFSLGEKIQGHYVIGDYHKGCREVVFNKKDRFLLKINPPKGLIIATVESFRDVEEKEHIAKVVKAAGIRKSEILQTLAELQSQG